MSSSKKFTSYEYSKYCAELPTRYHLIYLDYMDNFDGNMKKFSTYWNEKISTMQHIVDTGRLIEMGQVAKN